MNKKQHTLYGAIILLIGIIGGIAGTAFSMGAEQQRINGSLNANEAAIAVMKVQQEKEMDRYAEIITVQMIQLQTGISNLTTIVGNLRTDVHVLKALMERMEEDLKIRNNFD